MGVREFVVFVAACMAINALAIDIVLAALPAIGNELGAATDNDRQMVISAYLLGFGVSQLIYGPISDSVGRKPVLLFGLLVFALASLGSVASTTFGGMLISRVVQGFGAGAPRVVAMALVRDRYVGNAMGRIMSLAMMVFMIVPIVAPSLGQLILLVAPWRWIFSTLLIAGLAIAVWSLLRVEETLTREHRRSLRPAAMLAAYAVVLAHPVTRGYMVALGIVLAVLVTFISLAQQAFQQVYGVGGEFTVLFALIALFLSAAAFTNARLLRRRDMLRVTQGALGLFIVVSVVLLALTWMDRLPLVGYIVGQGMALFCFGFLGANLNALAMEPMGEQAGSAAALIGAVSMLIGTALGFVIARQFDGTLVPWAAGYLALGVTALAIVTHTGRKSIRWPGPDQA